MSITNQRWDPHGGNFVPDQPEELKPNLPPKS